MTKPRWILRYENRLIIETGEAGEDFPVYDTPPVAVAGEVVEVGEWQGRPCLAADLSAFPELVVDSSAIQPLSLREIFERLGEPAFALAGRAVQLLDWQRNHRYCGQCGTPTRTMAGETARQCPACGLQAYPRISPAVMVLVRDGERLLLARSPRFKPGVYSALAGFVEAGETLEQCAVREVREEVGVEIANLRYFTSQPWPFPNSLMVAFFADYAGGVIVPQAGEIEAAGWFTSDALPLLPDRISIARRLIEAALQK